MQSKRCACAVGCEHSPFRAFDTIARAALRLESELGASGTFRTTGARLTIAGADTRCQIGVHCALVPEVIMTSALAICVVVYLVRGVYLRALIARHELIGVEYARLVSTQLWRKPVLFCCRDGMGCAKLPTPRETRTRLVRFAGVPVWRHVETIGLPNQVADRIDAVAAHEFDSGFSPSFRATSLASLKVRVET